LFTVLGLVGKGTVNPHGSKQPVLKDLALEQESPAEFFSEIVTLTHCFESGPVQSTFKHQQTSGQRNLPCME